MIAAPTPRVRRPLEQVETWWTAAAASILILTSYLFRFPPLLNARSTNSDAAVVGLQAMHLLKGEYDVFLWGSGYQTSADAFVAAFFFIGFGSTPLALMLSSLTLHVVATVLVFSTLRRRFSPWEALLLSMPLVVSPASIHTYALYPPRQLSITLAVAAMWATHGAARRAGPPAQAWLAAGGILYGLAVSADPYPLVLAPIVIGYALIVSFENPMGRIPPLGLGLLAGFAPFTLLHRAARAKGGPLGLSLDVVKHNWDLLVQECLPWALSYKVYFARNVMDYRPWDPPIWIQAIQIAGAIIVLGIVLWGIVAVGRGAIPRSTRHLGFAGAMAFPVTIGAFLVSVMVMDHFSMRYLAVLTLMLPFAAAPAMQSLGPARFAALMLPHLAASAICGWVGYGPFVHGPVPVFETPELRDDFALLELLQSRKIGHAEADYWASYRLTFLWGETVIVVPSNPLEDRYQPYRRAFDAAPMFAYVFDPGRSRENLEEVERKLGATYPSVEKTKAGGHTVFLVTRGPAPPPAKEGDARPAAPASSSASPAANALPSASASAASSATGSKDGGAPREAGVSRDGGR